ncbi:MAG: EAL domain-containing protein, partial [Candidatus Moranbacteria bacterium]|nr:EAL domain-containing protein [Candidatus Moranbacteria bacterium]
FMITKASLTSKRILVVHDGHSVNKVLRMLLETKGYDVRVASSGEDAWVRFGKTYDLILLDLLPDQEDGFNVCRKLRETEELHVVPIIILSQRKLTRDIIESLYSGADDYLSKPFEYEELIARMEAVMRRSAICVSKKISKADQDIYRELLHIIKGGLITPYFQPIFLVKNFDIFGVEVLSRPITQTVLKNPEILFNRAMQFGCYQDLEFVAWQKALGNAMQWIEDKVLFLNCNPYLVEGTKFLVVKNLFDSVHIKTDKVILEITERSAISNYEIFYEHLCQYRKEGFQFAIDDVGGGYASLESIVETRPEIVKIDQHIIKNIHSDPYKMSIVKFIVTFCNEHEIMSVAEGVENAEDLKSVRELGVTAVQGYYLCRPTPMPDFLDIKKLAHILA